MELDRKTLASISHKLSAALELALNEGLHREKMDPTRVSRLRISSFPFCQVRWFLDLPRTTSKAHFVSSSSKYFTNVGHVLHGVMQNALTSVGIDAFGLTLIGDWKCLSCSKLYPICPEPKGCSCGHQKFKFEEVHIERDGLTGHVDTILSFQTKIKGNDQEFWVVIDYKTTSMSKLNASPCLMPYKDNVFQIGGYVGQLHEMGYPVLPLAFLIYVPRDNPWRFRLEPVRVDLEEETRRVILYKKRFKRVASVATIDELKDVIASRPCRKGIIADFDGCRYAASCAGPAQEKAITREATSVFNRVEAKLPIIKRSK